jgi:metal-sulfur cluster biosynthetic enzyme
MSAKVEDVTEAMKDVVDPELGINVVDLGLSTMSWLMRAILRFST